jgi:CheY-like chemotaxis protein
VEDREDQLILGFVVQDTGLGIPPEEMETIFEPFGQGKSGRHDAQGTGLGLPISRDFIRLMGGDLVCHSQVGQGTSFSFTITCERARAVAPPPRAIGEARVVGLAEDQRDFRILVVDDQPAGRQMLTDLLAPLGFQIQTAANGREALEQWHQWQPHLIWMDLAMPEMDGKTAIRHIREALRTAPRKVQSKILVFTAHGFQEDRPALLHLGCDDVLFKPCEPEVILNKLGEHLGVRYLTEGAVPAIAAAPLLTAATIAQGLQQLPPPWQATFAQAVQMGDGEQCTLLLGEVADPLLRDTLQQYLEEFDFFTLLEIMATFMDLATPAIAEDGMAADKAAPSQGLG